MTARPSRDDPYWGTLQPVLTAVVEGVPKLLDDRASSRRVREATAALTAVLRAETGPPHDSAASSAPLTLTGALSLIATARALLDSAELLEWSGSGSSPEGLTGALSGLEDQIGVTLRRQQAHRICGLYVIIDPQVTNGRGPMDIARGAVQGGARMLQLRDKLRDKGEILPLAAELQKLCQANDVLLIINDHVDLAATIGPDSVGVHVGQTDLPVAHARRVLAPQQVLGRSNREIPLLIESQEMGADHVAFGAIYPTSTKPGGKGPQGPERVKEARAVTQVPLVCIGGITAVNVAPVVESGADAICVTAAVGLAAEPEAAALELVEAIRTAGGKI